MPLLGDIQHTVSGAGPCFACPLPARCAMVGKALVAMVMHDGTKVFVNDCGLAAALLDKLAARASRGPPALRTGVEAVGLPVVEVPKFLEAQCAELQPELERFGVWL